MFVLDTKLKGSEWQFRAIDEAIRTAQFIRNKAIRFWMDNKSVGKYDLSKLCAVLATSFDFANKLNSMARQASAERAWQSIAKFFDNCKKKKPGKKGYPRFKKNTRSVEYKTSGWKLSDDRTHLTLTDGFKAGSFKLFGATDLNFYQLKQIKRVRIVKKADGYYAQFCIDVERAESVTPSGNAVGLEMGLNYFYTDSNGVQIENPRYLRKSEKALKRAQKKVSRRKKSSNNRKKAINQLGKKHLKISRQRKDFAVKTARAVVMSNDFVAVENLQVRNMVKNHHLAKSISDTSWSMFVSWLEYFAQVMGKVVVAVPPQYTSQQCSSCGATVKKSLSVRTHVCKCGTVLDRDHNAAFNILALGLKLAGLDLKNTPGHGEINAQGQINRCQQGKRILSIRPNLPRFIENLGNKQAIIEKILPSSLLAISNVLLRICCLYIA